MIPAIKSMPRTPIRGGNLGEVWVIAMTLELSHQPMHPIFIPWCAGDSPHERLVRKWCFAGSSMPECHRPPLRHSRGSGNPEGRGGTNHTQTLPATRPPFSYLGVPATARMSDWYESMSRTPIRVQFRHRPATPTTVARTTTAQGRRRDVALGLVPSQGRGAGHRRHLNPSINQCTQFSYPGVPATAGMGDWY